MRISLLYEHKRTNTEECATCQTQILLHLRGAHVPQETDPPPSRPRPDLQDLVSDHRGGARVAARVAKEASACACRLAKRLAEWGTYLRGCRGCRWGPYLTEGGP